MVQLRELSELKVQGELNLNRPKELYRLTRHVEFTSESFVIRSTIRARSEWNPTSQLSKCPRGSLAAALTLGRVDFCVCLGLVRNSLFAIHF